MSVVTAASPWTARRLRAEQLRERYPFAREVLGLYLALVPVGEHAWRLVQDEPPHPLEVARWAAERVLPVVVDATIAAAPALLRQAVRERPGDGGTLAGWLAGQELDPVDSYLARASLGPVLEALGDVAGDACHGEDGVPCPCCGAPPQLTYLESSGESLVSGRRSLLCSRCRSSWSYSRNACAACGESDETRLVVYGEHWHGSDGGPAATFPHLRIAGCTTCSRYLIEVDLERDGRAVPEVDELAALPLALYAADQGLTKVTPNLMGF